MQKWTPLKNISTNLFLAFLAVTSARPALSKDENQIDRYKVVSAAPYEQLSETFIRLSGWTGADGAYSVPLNSDLSLWLFGDTWIGNVSKGRRVKPTMINNSAAWQPIHAASEALAPFQFFWKTSNRKAESIIQSNLKDTWVWPGDSAMVDGRLYTFLHLIRRTPHDQSAWGFETKGHQLLQVKNPLSKPTDWQTHRVDLPTGFQFGNAAISDGKYLYAYGEYLPAAQGLNMHPIAVARINNDRLKDLDNTAWEYWCHVKDGFKWKSKLVDPVIVIPDGASEMSVSRVRGLSGFFATYSLPGLSQDIVVRHSEHLEGPWGDSELVYTCPPTPKSVFVYNAKAHPELSSVDGELILTYCQNTNSLKLNMSDAKIYAPRAVAIRLQKQ